MPPCTEHPGITLPDDHSMARPLRVECPEAARGHSFSIRPLHSVFDSGYSSGEYRSIDKNCGRE